MFKNILFPKSLCVTYSSSASVEYNTTIAAPGGDTTEDRNGEWGTFGRRRFNPLTAIIDTQQLELLRAFFRCTRGRAFSFRLEWPGDSAAVGSLIANTAGGTVFQLQKEYRVPEFSEDGIITAYCSEFESVRRVLVSTVYVTLNGLPVPVAQNPDYAYLWNDPEFNQLETDQTASVTEAGVLTLGQAITVNDELRASFQYQYVVRFDTDQLEESYVNFNSYTVNCPMVEVLE